jgi:hypothetical protein
LTAAVQTLQVGFLQFFELKWGCGYHCDCLFGVVEFAALCRFDEFLFELFNHAFDLEVFLFH